MPRWLIVLFTLIILAVAIPVFVLIGLKDNCLKHPPSMLQLSESLDADYTFTTAAYRLAASRIYEYKAANEFIKRASDGYTSIFMLRNSIDTPPAAATLSDVALFKLALCTKDRFSILVSYIPIFNHEQYAPCLRAYNPSKKQFGVLADGTPARDVIITEVLNIDEPIDAEFEDSTDDDLTKKIKSYAKHENVYADPSLTNDFIKSVLLSATDERLHDLLVNGYIGSS